MMRIPRMISGALTFALLLALLAGCATTETTPSSDPTATSKRIKFLSDYERLKPVEDMEGAEAWRVAGVAATRQGDGRRGIRGVRDAVGCHGTVRQLSHKPFKLNEGCIILVAPAPPESSAVLSLRATGF